METNSDLATKTNCEDNEKHLRDAEEGIQQNDNPKPENQELPNEKPKTIPIHFQAMRITVFALMKVLNIAYVPLFMYRMFQRSKRYPVIKDEILKIPATELAEKIRRKEISCVDVIEKYISRIKEVNPLINAIIAERFSEALEEARKLDEWISSSTFSKNEEELVENYPLLGVPLTVKGSIAVKGLLHTSGMVTRNKVVAEEDAQAVKQARDAGAIPLLVSNVPELCMNWETTNKLVGTTNNPHDTTRTCGGSSGGEASLLACGASIIGIGSDIAGSLRLPAHYCGVWGHKPTPKVVSDYGHYPNCPNRDSWELVFTLGPMSRYAKDLRALLKVILVPETQEKLRLSEKIDVKDIKIYFTEDLEDLLCSKVNNHCIGGVQKVVNHFKSICNTEPQKVDFHLLQYAAELATIYLLGIKDISHMFDNEGNGVYAECVRYMTCRSKHTLMAIFYGFLKKLANKIPTRQKENITNNLSYLREDFEKTLGKDGVFIMPTFPMEAFKHGDAMRNSLNSGYMSIFNALGFPVTNCPVGLSKGGLPLGVQVVGLPYCDNLTLTVAEEIEKAFGGWIEPKS